MNNEHTVAPGPLEKMKEEIRAFNHHTIDEELERIDTLIEKAFAAGREEAVDYISDCLDEDARFTGDPVKILQAARTNKSLD